MKCFLFYLLILFPVLCSAQTNFKPGFVVKNNGDTLKGFINYRERSNTPTSVTFRKELKGQSQLFDTKEILSYTINDQASYERFVVDISTSEEVIGRLSIGLDTGSKRDTVLLHVLQKGKNVTLYAFNDPVKLRYYIKEATDQEPKELIKQLYMKSSESNSMVVNNRYVMQILLLMRKYVSADRFNEDRLSRLRYAGKELGATVTLMNDQNVKKQLHAASRFFVGAGLNHSNSKYVGDNDLANAAAKNSSSSLPMVSAGIDIFGNPAIQRLVYRLELSLFNSNNDISTVTSYQPRAIQKHTFDQVTVQLTPQILYNVYNTEPLKIYFAGGVGVGYSRFKNNITSITNTFRNETENTTNYIDFEKINISLQFSAGLVLNKRFEFYGKFSPRTALTDYVYFNIVMQRVGFGVNYLFGKR